MAADWPLVSDILSCRAGVPEHLIGWRRAAERASPEPSACAEVSDLPD
ncbi:hypothetical protein [Silicimonas sp. MF1-12-2]